IAIAYVAPGGLSNAVAVPFFKNLLFAFGWFFVPFGAFVIVGASNAVNLTDGLDGLAIVPSMIAAGCFAVIAYLAGNLVFANYLQIHHVVGAGELTVFCGAMVGASLGFLWFNAPPAMVFMGDTGSLSIGAALGAISVVTKHELVLAIIGGLFVLEAISVIVQVASYKMTGRRVFRMAPLHHHFEQLGWEEPKIVIRYDGLHFVRRHLAMLPLALGLMFAVSLQPPRTIRRIAVIGFGISLALLALTFVIGIEIKGARRWINFPGLSLQPSEFVKPTFAVVAAWLFSEQMLRPRFPGTLICLALYLVVVAMLIKQPDIGMAAVV